MLSRADKITICQLNDSSYDGIFYLAVKSTQIYCIPSCTARFPKEKHIVFYSTRQKAESDGYRGCLRCHSAEEGFLPPWLQTLVAYLDSHITTKLTMNDLEAVVDKHRSTITTQFVKYYGSTPMEYHRRLKLDLARRQITTGTDYRDVAFTLGYESISGFRSAFKEQFNMTPGQMEVQ